jgi:hypothetical protein
LAGELNSFLWEFSPLFWHDKLRDHIISDKEKNPSCGLALVTAGSCVMNNSAGEPSGGVHHAEEQCSEKIERWSSSAKG